MEIFELRYFAAVAAEQNIHRASERLFVSPAALSKAIARLESELGLKLFAREGRHIRLTEQGQLLQRRASEILHLEESAKLELKGHAGTIQAVIAGPEVLLSRFGADFADRLVRRYPDSRCEFVALDDEEALGRVGRGEAHVAFVTETDHGDLHAKVLADCRFQTCVGEGHPLYRDAKRGASVPVEKLLTHAFASPSHPLLGQVGLKQSPDGWRDDKFPRKIGYRTSSLKLLEEFVVSGRMLAYLPDYHVEKLGLAVLKVTGCSYSCRQRIQMVVRSPREVGWIRQLF